MTAYSKLTQFETEPQIELEWFTCKVIKVDEEDFIAEVLLTDHPKFGKAFQTRRFKNDIVMSLINTTPGDFFKIGIGAGNGRQVFKVENLSTTPELIQLMTK
jgi:hypothetical protein